MKASENVFVSWKHDSINGKTICVVEVDEQQFIASSKCGHGDPYVKATGRKLSLERAVSKLERPVRTEIWNSLRAKGVTFK